jgi:hypothetical protein
MIYFLGVPLLVISYTVNNGPFIVRGWGKKKKCIKKEKKWYKKRKKVYKKRKKWYKKRLGGVGKRKKWYKKRLGDTQTPRKRKKEYKKSLYDWHNLVSESFISTYSTISLCNVFICKNSVWKSFILFWIVSEWEIANFGLFPLLHCYTLTLNQPVTWAKIVIIKA